MRACSPRFKDLPTNSSWLQFREIPKSELKPGVDNATSFTSICINTAIYSPSLVSQCLKNGVVFKRAIFKHICDAAAPGVHHAGKTADLVVDCTGLSASRIGGTRVEREYINGVPVVHLYGQGGAGHQSSYGCAQEVVKSWLMVHSDQQGRDC